VIVIIINKKVEERERNVGIGNKHVEENAPIQNNKTLPATYNAGALNLSPCAYRQHHWPPHWPRPCRPAGPQHRVWFQVPRVLQLHAVMKSGGAVARATPTGARTRTASSGAAMRPNPVPRPRSEHSQREKCKFNKKKISKIRDEQVSHGRIFNCKRRPGSLWATLSVAIKKKKKKKKKNCK
jgi:hypothetical protein